MRWWEWLHNKQSGYTINKQQRVFSFWLFLSHVSSIYYTSLCILLIFHCKNIFLYASNHYECNRVKTGAHHPIHKVQVPSRISCTSLRNTSLSPWGYILFFSATIACWLAFLASFWRELNISCALSNILCLRWLLFKVCILKGWHTIHYNHSSEIKMQVSTQYLKLFGVFFLVGKACWICSLPSMTCQALNSSCDV